MQYPVLVRLRETSGVHVVGRIAFDSAGLIRVEVSQDGCRREGILQILKCSCASLVPYKGYVFLGELRKRCSLLCEIFNEPSVEIGESQEALDVFDVLWLKPVDHGGNFAWVHRIPLVPTMRPRYLTS